MPESQSALYRRMMTQADNSIFNAIADLYGYYCVLMRADPVLAAALEITISNLDDCRGIIRLVHLLAWEHDDPQFDSIGEVTGLILETRREVFGKGQKCQDFSRLWEASAPGSSRLLEKRAAVLQKLSDSHLSKLEE